MNHPHILTQTEAYVKESLSGEGSGHDWWHIYRVRQNALAMAQHEPVDPFVVQLAALLHDIADHKFHDGDETVGPRVARAWLEQLDVEPAVIDHVCRIIADISFKGAGVDTPMHTLEGQVVQDADRLDAIGAIGIARAFAYGGHKNRLLYDPDISPEAHTSFDAYKNSQAPTINHFYEKLLLLKDRMNTPTARRLAESRHAFMEMYLQQFFAEWNGEGLSVTAMSDHLPLPELEKRLLQAIDQRYQAQAGRDLADYVFANHLFQTFPPTFLEFSYQHRHDIAAYLADEPHVARLTEYCIRATKTYTYRRNQFINFSDFYDDLLTVQYRHFLGQLQAALAQSDSRDALALAYATVLQQHHSHLRLIFSTYCVSYQPTGLAGHDLLKTVPCDEYSPLFQLSLLHIDAATLMEPILDIGCGASGALVDYLLAQRHTAFGLDRLAPTRPQFSQQDWFTFDYGQNQWGTIIAHQSFSTHFIYAHLHSDDQADQFARLYMKLLAGLKPGGALYYAPGLPFIEEHLTARPGFSLTKTIIETDTTLGIGELFYAVKIEKAA